MNNKASVRDIGIFVGVIFCLAFLSFTSYFIYDTISDNLKNTTEFNSTPTAITALDGGYNAIDKFDYLIFMVVVGFLIGIVATSFLIKSYPVFVPIYIIALLVINVSAGILSYIWGQVTTASSFGTTISNFPITNFILNYFVVFSVVAGFIGIIVIYTTGQE